MGAAIHPRRLSRCRQGLVDATLPQDADTLASPFVGQQGHPSARLRIAVPNDQVGMGIGRIPSGLVDGSEPRGACPGEAFGEDLHQAFPADRGQLTRQGQDQLVDHPPVLPVAPLLSVQPSPRRLSFRRHPRSQKNGGSTGAGDVADVRSRRPGRMGAPPHAAQVQAVDRHPAAPGSRGGHRGLERPRPEFLPGKNIACYSALLPALSVALHSLRERRRKPMYKRAVIASLRTRMTGWIFPKGHPRKPR